MRKNRVLRAGFLGTSSVMDMLEANWRTFCAQMGVDVEDGPAVEEEMEEKNGGGGGAMMVDDNLPENGIDEEAEAEAENDKNEETEWAGIMDIDDDTNTPPFFHDNELNEQAKKINNRANNPKRKRGKGKVAQLVREKVLRVLEVETALADKRARMCDEGDFLRLLWAFNKEGIHFS